MYLTHEQMMRHVRIRLGLDPQSSSCSVRRVAGIDIDSMLANKVRQWYLDLLDNAPVQYLEPVDISRDLSVTPTATEPLVGVIFLPPEVRRLLTLQLEGWHVPAPVLDAESHPIEVARQANPYLRGGSHSPVVLQYGRILYVYSLPTADPERLAVTHASAIVDEGDEVYRLDEAALGLLPDNLPAFKVAGAQQ